MSKPHTILVVEDDENALAGLLEMLRDAGYQTTGAATFDAAKRLLDAGAYDLLLTDVRLRAFNGLHLVHRCRDQHPGTAMIIITGHHDPLLDFDARRLGAISLSKPIVPAALLAAIGKAIEEAKHTRKWPRKRLPDTLPAMVDDWPARVVDVSYGGVRFEMPATSPGLASAVQVCVPALGLRVRAQPIWMDRAGDSGSVSCGAAIVADAMAGQAWRQLVDAVVE